MRMKVRSAELDVLASGPAISGPGFTPDGASVIYTDAGSEGKDAFRIGVNGGSRVRITANCQTWGVDPTGRLLACCDRDDVEYVVPLDGGAPVWRHDIPTAVLRWTPNGALAYVDKSGLNIWVQQLNQAPPRQATFFTSEKIHDFVWSGKEILLSRGGPQRKVVLITGVRLPSR